MYKSASAYGLDVAFGHDPVRTYGCPNPEEDLPYYKKQITEGQHIFGSSGIATSKHVREGVYRLVSLITGSEEQLEAYLHPGQGAAGRSKPQGGTR